MVDITSELESERKKEGEIKVIEVALISNRIGKERTFKFVTNLKEKIKNALCVAEGTKNELLAAYQADHKGKDLKAVARKLTDYLSSSTRTTCG